MSTVQRAPESGEVEMIPAISISTELLLTVAEVEQELLELMPTVAALSERMRPLVAWSEHVYQRSGNADEIAVEAIAKAGLRDLWLKWTELAGHALAASSERSDIEPAWFAEMIAERNEMIGGGA